MNLDFPPMQPQPEGVADQGPYAKTLALKPQRREERSPAPPGCALRVSAVKSPLGKFPQVVMISREKDRLEGCATCSPRL